MQEKRHFEGHFEQIRAFLLPLIGSFSGKETPGRQNRERILDSSGESASSDLAAALHGSLTNPFTKWFSIRAERNSLNDNERVALWLSQARNRMMNVFNSPRSGFAPVISEVYQEIVDFGTAGMYIADRPGQRILFQSRPINELAIAENADGKIDTVHREFDMTARQVVQKFGEAAGAGLAKEAERNGERKFRMLHAIYPNSERRSSDARDSANLPVASDYILMDHNQTLRKRGYHEMPMVVARWNKRSGESWGRGCGGRALADVKSLQEGMRLNFRVVEKSADPPLMVADDGVVGPVRTGASAINYVRRDLLMGRWSPISGLQTGADPMLQESFLDTIRQRIDQAYFRHLIQMSRDPRMTATQVLKLDEEALRVLGPFLGRLYVELLGPIIERVFGIMLRAGALGEVPPELHDQDITIEYVSPLAKAQRLSEVTAVSQLVEVMAPYISQDPSLMDNINSDQALRHVGDRLSLPPEILRDPREVAKIRERRQQAQQEAQQAETLERGAAAAQSAGQALDSGGLRQALGLGSGGNERGAA